MIKKTVIALTLFLSFSAISQASSFNVSLDGFCNTFTLNVTTPFIAGTRQGCGYTVIDGGAVVKVSGVSYRLTADTNDEAEIFTWYFAAPVGGHGNWYLYSSDGNTNTLVNSGTYSKLKSPDEEPNRGAKDVTAPKK